MKQGFIPDIMQSHDILIKYIGEEWYAKQLEYGGLFMRTPRYYKEQGVQNMSMGDPSEFDDLYPIWCASIFQAPEDIKIYWNLDMNTSQYSIKATLSEEASEDVVKALNGFVDNNIEFQPLGKYAVVMFNAAKYIGGLVEGFTDASFSFVDKTVRAVPIECGMVSYGEVLENHPKLYKSDSRFKYQREYRIRLGLCVSPNKYDVILNLTNNRILKKKYTEMSIFNKEEILDEYYKNGRVSFPFVYQNIANMIHEKNETNSIRAGFI